MLKKSLLTALACILLATPLALAAESFELAFQSGYPPTQSANIEVLIPWSENFAKATDNKLIVNFFPVSAIVDVNEASHAVKNGMLDIAFWGPSSFPKEAGYCMLSNLPFITKNSQHGTNFVWSLYETIPEVKKELDNVGETLAIWTSASFGLSSVNAPITSPADIKGKRVLIVSAQDSVAIEAWGGVPVFVTPSDVYVGLQRGMGEIFYTAIPYQKGLRIMEVAKYLTPLPSTSNMMVLSINKDTLSDLPEEYKKMIAERSGKTLSQQIAANLDADVENCKDIFEAAGCKVIDLTPEQQNAFFIGLQDSLDNYWVKALKDFGIKNDIKAYIDKSYELSKAAVDPKA